MPPQTENNPTNQSSMGNVMPKTNNEKKPVGPIIGIIIIVLVLTLGGFYFYGNQLNEKNGNVTPEEILNAPDASVVSLEQQSPSDEISDIEADLNATDLNDLDKELQDIENQL